MGPLSKTSIAAADPVESPMEATGTRPRHQFPRLMDPAVGHATRSLAAHAQAPGSAASTASIIGADPWPTPSPDGLFSDDRSRSAFWKPVHPGSFVETR
jgi:hypothetical protein